MQCCYGTWFICGEVLTFSLPNSAVNGKCWLLQVSLKQITFVSILVKYRVFVRHLLCELPEAYSAEGQPSTFICFQALFSIFEGILIRKHIFDVTMTSKNNIYRFSSCHKTPQDVGRDKPNLIFQDEGLGQKSS